MKQRRRHFVVWVLSFLLGFTEAGEIEQIRSKIQKAYKDKKEYDEADVEYVKNNDRMPSWALEHKKDVSGAAQHLHDTLRWRKDWGVSELKTSDFPKETFEAGDIVEVGKDKDGDPVMWFQTKSKLLLNVHAYKYKYF